MVLPLTCASSPTRCSTWAVSQVSIGPATCRRPVRAALGSICRLADDSLSGIAARTVIPRRRRPRCDVRAPDAGLPPKAPAARLPGCQTTLCRDKAGGSACSHAILLEGCDPRLRSGSVAINPIIAVCVRSARALPRFRRGTRRRCPSRLVQGVQMIAGEGRCRPGSGHVVVRHAIFGGLS